MSQLVVVSALLGALLLCCSTAALSVEDFYQAPYGCRIERLQAQTPLPDVATVRELCLGCNWPLMIQLQADDQSNVVSAMITCLQAFYKLYHPMSTAEEFWRNSIAKKGRPMVRLG